MAELITNQEPPVAPTAQGMAANRDVANDQGGLEFPYRDHQPRLDAYDYFERLFMGEHYDAFRIKIDNIAYGEAYNKLRYVKANVAGLISKVCADMLFTEPVSIKVKNNQEFIDALVFENMLEIQFYESALGNSYMGDALFKLRIGPRNPDNPHAKSTIIIEDMTPKIWFPGVNGFNVRQAPNMVELAWTFKVADKKYLRKEIHKPGTIENKVYLMNGNKIAAEVSLDILGITGLQPIEYTKIDDMIIVHIPNWKTGSRFFGISDYYDLDAIFYAINNRLTKVDNVLDKHTDPILAVPEGVLDKDGKVKRKALNMVEIPAGAGDSEKPEYIVWNANLDSAFKQLDKLVEFMFMTSETSPDVLGMGQGQSDSGRALKYKLLRTIAKVARKKLYYDYGIKKVIYLAMQLSNAWGVEVGGYKWTGKPEVPELIWGDGIPVDYGEAIENETKRKDAGLQTTRDALMAIDGIDKDTAEKKAKEIKDEDKIEMPPVNNGNNPFAKPGQMPGKNPPTNNNMSGNPGK